MLRIIPRRNSRFTALSCDDIDETIRNSKTERVIKVKGQFGVCACLCAMCTAERDQSNKHWQIPCDACLCMCVSPTTNCLRLTDRP